MLHAIIALMDPLYKSDLKVIETRLETFATKSDLANIRAELSDRISGVQNSLGRLMGGCTAFLAFIMALIKFLG